MKIKKGFTLVEILLVLVIVSIGLMSVIYYVQGILKQVHYANQKVIAMNLAKEGIESMYYARNQRILEHTWADIGVNAEGKLLIATSDRSKCRLSLKSDDCPSTTAIFWNGHYSMHFLWTTDKKVVVYFQKHNNDIDLSEGAFIEQNKPYALYLSGNEWTTSPGDQTDNLTRYGRFFRKIEGEGIFQGDTPLNCNGDYNHAPACNNNSPKEYRFCSVVKYVGAWVPPSEVKFCAVMTNFFSNVNQEG